MENRPFLAVEPFEAAHPDALAVYCSDGRFTNAVEELFRSLGHRRLDTVTMPGGPALFNVWLAGMSDSMAIGAAVRFLVEAHGIRRVILLAHEGCGFYRKHYGALGPEAIRSHQEDDLRQAARVLRQTHDSIDVLLYRAGVQNGRVLFTPVE